MHNYTDQQLQDMTLEDAKRIIENEVYKVTGIVERLEYVRDTESNERKIIGNGHHIRQEMAAMAAKIVERRWGVKREKPTRSNEGWSDYKV